jgi:hypothetical protein
LSKVDQPGGSTFDFPFGSGRVLLCDLLSYPTEKIKHLVNCIVYQFNAGLGAG